MSTRPPHGCPHRNEDRRPNPARALALAVLAVVTSLAVGRAFSWWVVPGYLALMGWLVAPPPPRRAARTPAPPAGPEIDPGDGPDEGFPDPSPTPPPEPPSAEIQPRSRKRTRKPKAKLAVAPPEPAVWVRVGPGQFVRAEGVVDPEPTPEATSTDPAPEPPVTPTPEPATVEAAPRRRRAVRIEPPEGFRPRPLRFQRPLGSHALRWRATRLLID